MKPGNRGNKKGNLPNLIVIGGQKCGSSSLHHYLSFHPDIIMSSHKELNYFCKELQYKRGQAWYMRQFKGNAKIYGESSPSYTNFPEYKGVAQRMHEVIPKAKLIYLLRDPVDRIVSQYLDRFKGGQENRPLSAAVRSPENNYYLWFSKYYAQLEQFLPYYPRERILLLKTADLKINRVAALQVVFRFLGVDEAFTCPAFAELINVSKGKFKKPKPRKWVRYYMSDKLPAAAMRKVSPFLERKLRKELSKGEPIEKPIVDDQLKEYIRNYLKPDIDKLTSFSGLDISEWFS